MKKFFPMLLLVLVTGLAGVAMRSPATAMTAPGIPHNPADALIVTCEMPDTLFGNHLMNAYEGNPFPLYVTVTNNSNVVMKSIQTVVFVMSGGVIVQSPSGDLEGDLEANTSRRDTIYLIAKPHAVAMDHQIRVYVTTEDFGTVECNSMIHIPALRLPDLDVQCRIHLPDTVYFNEKTGVVEYTSGRISALIRNNGSGTARRVRGTLLLGENTALEANERAMKILEQEDIAPAGADSIMWDFRLLPVQLGEDQKWITFEVLVTMENGDFLRCSTRLYLRSFSRHISLSLPESSILRHGYEREIPIRIKEATGKQLSEYNIRLTYDPDRLRINGASSAGTLTGEGWSDVIVSVHNGGPTSYPPDNAVEIRSHGVAIDADEGILVKLRVEGVMNRVDGAGSYGFTTLHFDTTRSSLNKGLISFSSSGGNIFITDDCLEPLTLGLPSFLRQNHPNPFNPMTVIPFILTEAGYAQLRVIDTHGRNIAILVDGMLHAGQHTATFDARELPSGMYFYRLEHARGMETKKMVLMR